MSGRRQINKSLAIVAISTFMLAGCNKGDDSSNKDAAGLDHGDPQAVAEAWGEAIAAGDCETAAELHITEDYAIDCSNPEQHNVFADAKNMQLTFDAAMPTDDRQGGSEEAKSFHLSFNTADGYLVTDHADLDLRDGKYLVANRGPELSDPDAG